MKSSKKLLTFIISVSIMLQLFVLPMNASAARDPYITFSAVSYDSYEQDSSKITFAADRVGTIASGDWLCFKAIDFGELGPYKVDFTTAHPSGHGSAIRLRLDDPKGEVFVDVPYVTSNYSDPVTSSAVITKKVTGVHDLYISSVDSKINFLDVTFYERTAEGRFKYEPYRSGSAFSDLAGADCAQAVDMLYNLGIIPKTSDGLYRPDVEASRGEFAYSIFRLYKKQAEEATEEENAKSVVTKFTDVDPFSQYAEAIAFLSDTGIMNGVSATEFDPYSYIRYEDAVVVAMRVLGYSEIADANGGYSSGYLRTASKVKVGTSVTTNDGYLSRGNMAILLDNLLNEPCLTASSITSGSIQFTKDSGILAINQNTYPGTGIVSATVASTINAPSSSLKEDEVLIGGVVYKTGSVSVGSLLGYECDFWYEENDGRRTIRAIMPSLSTEYFTLSTMDGDDIFNITNSVVEYFPAGSDKKEDIRITSDTYVVYNGVAIDKRLTTLVEYESGFKGTVTYVENGDGSSMLFIDEYKDYVVESVDHTTLIMKVKGSADEILLDGEENLVYIADNDGITKKPNQLKTGDIVTVYQSKNTRGPKVTRVYTSDETASGMVSELQNYYIYIDGTPYSKSNSYTDDDSLLGEQVMFSLNIYGDIVRAEMESLKTAVSGMFWEYDVVNSDAFGSGDVYVKLIAEDSKAYIYPLAKSVTYNGRRFKVSQDIVAPNALTSCRELSELNQEEIIRYKLNAKNQIFMIDTYESLDGGANDTLTKFPTLTVSHKWDTKAGVITLYNSTSNPNPGNGVYYFPGDALVYTMFANTDTTIPDANEARDSLCAVVAAKSSILTNENVYVKGELYSLTGDDYKGDILVFERTTEGLDWKPQIIISKIFKTLDSEKNECTAISGIGDGGKTLTYLLSEEQFAYPSDITLLSRAQVGDVIRIREHNSMVVDVEFMLLNDGAASRGTITPKSCSTANNTTGKKSRGVYGTVEYKAESYIIIKRKDKTGNDVSDLVGMPAVVTQCKEKSNGDYKVEVKGSMINISVGDTVYAAIHNGDTNQLIIYDYDN